MLNVFPHKIKFNFDFPLLKKFWKFDLIASLSVSLVGIPLAIGTALAGGLPPMTGIVAIIVGGLITTFLRGSHLTINGPGNGLIVLLPLVMVDLQGIENSFGVLMAIFLVSGLAMFLMGLFKLGRFGDIIPSTVVYGMMAVIGIIIVSLQLHPLIGHAFSTTDNTLYLIEFINTIPKAHPVATSISVISMLILTLHKTVYNKLIHFLPAPMWVLFIVLPIVYVVFPQLGIFKQLGSSDFVVFPKTVHLKYFIPNFSCLDTLMFWKHVISFTFVITVKSIISAKGVEKLDRKKRPIDINDDLIGMGVGTIISAFFGGLPVCTILACSSVNVNNNAQSRWSNVFQALITFIIIVFFTKYLSYLPNTVLAAILFFAGYKLFTPKLFIATWYKGKEQLLILIITILSSYILGIKIGVIIGTLFTLITHLFIYDVSFKQFFNQWRATKFKITELTNSYVLEANGILNFTHILRLKRTVEPHLNYQHVHLQLENTKLIDLTIMEYLQNLIENQASKGKDFKITGLGLHTSMSSHPHALHYVSNEKNKIKVFESLPLRVQNMRWYAFENNWDFETEVNWNFIHLDKFFYFLNKRLEFSRNIIFGKYTDVKIPWEISDLNYGEGLDLVDDTFKITVQLVFLPEKVAPFILDKEELFDKISDFINHNEIDFKEYPEFSSKYDLKTSNKERILQCFTPAVFDYLVENEAYHIECVGDKLLIFKNRQKMDLFEVKGMVNFTEGLIKTMHWK